MRIKKRDKLLFLLALNAVPSLVNAESKYDKLYNNLVKNIEIRKSNEDLYKLIERMLNQKNKEIRDLYTQADYIAKPEYLEWQVFFSSLYNKAKRGFSGDVKPFQDLPDDKEVDLGFTIDRRVPNINIHDIGIPDIEIPVIEVNGLNFDVPENLALPNIEINSFSEPNINIIQFNISPQIFSLMKGGPTIESSETGFFPDRYLGIITQMDLTSGSINVRIDDTSAGYFELKDVTGNPSKGKTIDSGGLPLPSGNYSSSTPYLLGVLGSQNTAITRIGSPEDEQNDVSISLEVDDIRSGWQLISILRFFSNDYEDGSGTRDYPSLNEIESNGWITSEEKNKFSRYLDTSIGETVSNKGFHIMENNASLYLSGVNASAFTMFGYIEKDVTEVFINNGTIIGLNEAGQVKQEVGGHSIIQFLWGGAGQTTQRSYIVDNTGVIEMRAPESAFVATDDQSYMYRYVEGSSRNKEEGTSKYIIMNNGDLKMYGNHNIGLYTESQGSYNMSDTIGESYYADGTWMKYRYTIGNENTVLKLNNPMTILGDENIGLSLKTVIDFDSSKFKLDIGTEDPKQSVTSSDGVNGLENSGNLGANDFNYTEDSIGIYIDLSDNLLLYSKTVYDALNPSNNENINIVSVYSPQITLSDYLLNIGEYSRRGIGLVVQNNGDTILGGSSDPMTNHEINLLAGGENSAGIYITGSDSIVTTDGMIMNIGGNKQVGTQVENNGIFYHKNGNINVNGTNNTGIAVKASGTAELSNAGKLDVSAGNLGVYNDGTFNMTGGSIFVDGLNSVGIYSETNSSGTNLSGGTIRSENGGIGLYAGASSVINLNAGINLVAGNKGLLFYNYDGGSPSGKYSVTGNVKATVEKGGIAFYLKYGTNLENYLNTSFTGISGGNLGLKMESESILYLIDGEGSTLSLTTIDGMVAPMPNLANHVSISSDSAGDYIPVSMNKGTLILDRNIDMNNDIYSRSEFTLLSVTLNNGVTLSGTQEKQVGIAQRNYLGSMGINDITVTNQGIIDLSGNKAVGIAADYGHIVNTGTIKTTGNDSVGIYSANGTYTENNGEIVIGGSSTAGIYGTSYLDGVTTSAGLGYGNDEIRIENNGKMTSTSGKTYGIYANNLTGNQSKSVVTLGSGSDINLQNSSGGVGIYVNNGNLTGGGKLTVGSDSVGIYAKDSEINLTGLTLNLTGNNILGFYLDGNTNFSGTGDINISGNNIAIFNILSNGAFSQNFNISSTGGSSYTIGNVNNGTFYYNGTANLAENGSLINGRNSSVLLDNGSMISTTGNGVVGAVLDGQYNGTLPSGFTSGIDAENRGTMTLGNNSSGLYGQNGSRIRNGGLIALGESSIGLHTNGGGSFIENSGTIGLGTSSVGIYGKNSDKLENSGKLSGTGRETVGIYSEGTGTLNIINSGNIDLSGDKSIGIYSLSTGGAAITNNGSVIIGNSSDNNNPSVGIYSVSSSDTIVNNGTISAGSSSVGVYTKGGTLQQNNTVSAGDNGTGIYADGGIINLNNNSTLNVLNNQSIGVYALNGASIQNNGITTVGNGSYGYVLRTGAMLTNTTDISLDSDSIAVYGDSSGNIQNNGKIYLNGSNGIGFYTVNGGTIQNTGDILAQTGTSNVGIYNENGLINNSGNLSIGDSVIRDFNDSTQNSYAIGIYGDRTGITNSGDIDLGYYGVGIYSKNNNDIGLPTINSGKITSNSEGAIGIFVENGVLQNTGNIELSGDKSIGIYANKKAEIVNSGTITMNGDDSTGIYLNILSTLNNTGIININGKDSEGIIMKGGSTILNQGTINLGSNAEGSVIISHGETSYPVPGIINAGIINVEENFELKGIDVSIKVNPDTITTPTLPEDLGASFVSDAVKFNAPGFNTSEPIGILGGFAEGTHAEVYKLKDVFNPMTEGGGPDSGLVKVRSKSLTWTATPVLNERGNVDIWMQKIPYDNFTSGLWYEDFGRALDKKYVGSIGNAGKIFDKIDLIETEMDFRKTMSSLSGDIYSNMNQREQTVADIFEDSLGILQNSNNNTKENVKVNIIAGKGEVKEETEGVTGYDYTSAGVQLLREVERTYRHTFGYSLGYLHTNFDYKDTGDSEEKVDTLQLGFHNKYKVNDWLLKNDVTGRISFHNMERNIEWSHSGKSEMTGRYESYSLSSDNKLGREFELGKRGSIMPYGGLKVMYGVRPTFSEKGLESLEVDGNDAWSVKPKAGVELKGTASLGTNWQLKGSLDLSYEYELTDFNEREYAKLTAVEDTYHKLAKPEDEKGIFRTKATVGIEIEDRYGIFLTGEYKLNDDGHNNDDYRAGIMLKAVF